MTRPSGTSPAKPLPEGKEQRPSRLARFVIRGQLGALRETELARLTGARR